MSWFSNIFTSGASTVIDSVGTAIDKLVTSDEEKIALRNELMKAQIDASIKGEELALQQEGEITARWQSDNEHLVTRLVRPFIVTWLVVVFTIMAFMDGNVGEFKINTSYAPIFETLLVTAIFALFGGRSAEKITKTIKK